jgi:hypothetical protein
MIILSEKKKPREQQINEAQEVPILRFQTLIEDIDSGTFKPNRINIFPEISTRFNVNLIGNFATFAGANFIDFSVQGPAKIIISIGENDVSRIHRSNIPGKPYYRITMKNRMTFFIFGT